MEKVKIYRVEFWNKNTEGWLVANLDFDTIKDEYNTIDDAQEDIDAYNAYERDEGLSETDFRIVEC